MENCLTQELLHHDHKTSHDGFLGNFFQWWQALALPQAAEL